LQKFVFDPTLQVFVVISFFSHAKLHDLVTPPRVCFSSFRSASRCSPRSYTNT